MSRVYDIELSCGCLLSSYGDYMIPCHGDNCKADQEYFNESEERIKYQKILQKGINLLKNNPNAIIEILQVTTRLSYLRGRIFEQNHPTKQTFQRGSGDVLSKDLRRSGGSAEVKTDDLNSIYKCGHRQITIFLDDNILSISAYEDWVNTVGYKGNKTKCWDCYAHDS